MILSVRKNTTSRKILALLVCLLMAAGSVQGTVLCFGADGHVEFESAFHEQCFAPNHNPPADEGSRPCESKDQQDDRCHCTPCVDVPVDFGLTLTCQTIEQLDGASVAVYADMSLTVSQPIVFEHLPLSSDYLANPFYSPLRTIILLV